MRIVLSIIVLILLLPTAFSQCITPESGMSVTEDVRFCSGEFEVEKISVDSSDITIDCEDSVLKGPTISYGFYVKGKRDVEIRNCQVQNYETAFYIERSNVNLVGNIIKNNINGITLLSSEESNYENNVFESNHNNVLINDAPEEKEEIQLEEEEEFTETEEEVEKEKPVRTDHIVYNVKKDVPAEPNEDLFEKTGITEEQNIEATDAINLKKTRQTIGDKSKFEFNIEAKKNIDELRIVEYIPNGQEIDLSEIGSDFILGEEENIIETRVSGLEIGDRTKKSYEVEHTADLENPFTILDAIFKKHDPFLTWAFAIFIIEYVFYFGYLRSKVKKYKNLLSHLDPYKDFLMFKKIYHKVIHSLLGIYIAYNMIEKVILPLIYIIGPRIVCTIVDAAFLLYIIIITVEVKKAEAHQLPIQAQ